MGYNYKDLGLSNTKEMFAKANKEGYESYRRSSKRGQTNSRADSQRMAGEPPGRKESGLHSRDRTCKAYGL